MASFVLFLVAVLWRRPAMLTYCSANGGRPLTFPAGMAITQSGSSWGGLICLLALGARASAPLSPGSTGRGLRTQPVSANAESDIEGRAERAESSRCSLFLCQTPAGPRKGPSQLSWCKSCRTHLLIFPMTLYLQKCYKNVSNRLVVDF